VRKSAVKTVLSCIYPEISCEKGYISKIQKNFSLSSRERTRERKPRGGRLSAVCLVRNELSPGKGWFGAKMGVKSGLFGLLKKGQTPVCIPEEVFWWVC